MRMCLMGIMNKISLVARTRFSGVVSGFEECTLKSGIFTVLYCNRHSVIAGSFLSNFLRFQKLKQKEKMKMLLNPSRILMLLEKQAFF